MKRARILQQTERIPGPLPEWTAWKIMMHSSVENSLHMMRLKRIQMKLRHSHGTANRFPLIPATRRNRPAIKKESTKQGQKGAVSKRRLTKEKRKKRGNL